MHTKYRQKNSQIIKVQLNELPELTISVSPTTGSRKRMFPAPNPHSAPMLQVPTPHK